MFQWCLLIRYSDLEAGKDILSHHILNYRTKNLKHFASTSNYNVEKEMATHSSILAYRILWTEKPGRLLSTGSHRVRHDWSDLACVHALEKEIATQSSVLAWRIPQGRGSLVGCIYGVAQSRTRLKRLSSSSSKLRWLFIVLYVFTVASMTIAFNENQLQQIYLHDQCWPLMEQMMLFDNLSD